VSALVEAGRLDDALDANMFLGRDARRFRGDDLELADLTTARSADLLAAKGRFYEARQVFAELVDLRIRRPEMGPDAEPTLAARRPPAARAERRGRGRGAGGPRGGGPRRWRGRGGAARPRDAPYGLTPARPPSRHLDNGRSARRKGPIRGVSTSLVGLSAGGG